MVADLKEIQLKLDKAHATLNAMCEILNQIAGRKELSSKTALRLVGQGKKVDL